ncbi:MAG: hypothetical protein ACXAB9_13820, partial [Candidatus Thorarchaeota archaeon]
VARTVGGELKFTDRGTSSVQSDSGQQPTVQQRQEVPQQKRTSTEEPTERRSGGDEEEGGDGKKTGENATLVFGRFNPPTVGHKKLLDA